MEHSSCNTTSFSSEFSSFFPEILSGSLSEPITHVSLVELMNLSMPIPISNIMYNNSIITPIGPVREHAMNDDLVKCLTAMYEVLFSGCTITHTTSLCQRFVRVKVGNILYSSKLARTVRNRLVCAHWLKSDAGSINTSLLCRPGCVQYFIRHNIQLQRNSEQFTENMYLGASRKNLLSSSKHSVVSRLCTFIFICISRIASRCANGCKYNVVTLYIIVKNTVDTMQFVNAL